MLHYCSKCGRFVHMYSNDEKKCDFCNSVVRIVPDKYRGSSKIKKGLEQEFMEKYIWSSPEFDPELHKKMEHWLDTRWDKPSKKPSNPYGIECPYCHSTDIQRIYGVTLSVFTDVSAVGKQFQCRFCSAYF